MLQVRRTHCKWNRPRARKHYKKKRNKIIRRLARQHPGRLDEAPLPKYKGWAD